MIKNNDLGLPIDSQLIPLLRQNSDSQFIREYHEYRALSVKAFAQKSYTEKIIFRSPKGFKKTLDAEVVLWQKIFAAASMLYAHSLISLSPMQILKAIILENELVMLPFIDASKLEKFSTATEVITLYQAQNKTLMDCDSMRENPFYGAVTSAFCLQAMQFASESKGWFRRDFWLPMIKARGNFIKVMRDEGSLLSDSSGKVITQGRKKLCVG